MTNVLVPEPEKRPDKGSTLNRLASILRPSSGIMKSGGLQVCQKDEKNTNSLPRSQHLKANKVIDKEILRNLEISNPIPQKEIEIPTPAIPVITADTEKKNVVLRAQSMRDSKITPRPNIQTFGSMRQTTPVKRPTSIPASTRPTAPPPGPPTATSAAEKINESGKIPGLPGYQTPQVKSAPKVIDNAYDDCMSLVPESLTKITEESPTSDNIYAVIEEAIPEKRKNQPEDKQIDNEYKLPKPVENPGNPGMETMGLLSEIVLEISSRNFDSIYSTATLSRKPANESEEPGKNTEDLGSNSSLGAYVNSTHYKSPGSIYSNSASGKFNSSSSTTSSGYLNPSALNVPRQAPERTDAAARQTDKGKLASLNSSNPNLNDDISKELGMKPASGADSCKTGSKTRPIQRATNPKTEEDKVDGKDTKPVLGRTKTPPNIAKSSKDARQGLENAFRSKQHSDGSLKGSRQGSSSPAATATAQQPGAGDKQDASATVNRLSLKTVPCSPKDNAGKFNSPDLVSSCSNSNQISTKSPDVLASSGKFSFQPRTVQKAAAAPPRTQTVKSPSTPFKPLNVATKTAATLADRKKSPTSGTVGSKPLPAKEPAKVAQAKLAPKTEAKTGEAKVNPVQRAATGKSNVASLQQKFEANRNANAARTVTSGLHRKTMGKEASGARK